MVGSIIGSMIGSMIEWGVYKHGTLPARVCPQERLALTIMLIFRMRRTLPRNWGLVHPHVWNGGRDTCAGAVALIKQRMRPLDEGISPAAPAPATAPGVAAVGLLAYYGEGGQELGRVTTPDFIS